MLTCVDGVSLRQNSRQDSPWGGKSPFGQRLGENHRNPLLPELGIPALFCGVDRLRFSTGKKGWFPVPQRHPASRTRRVTGWFPGFGRWTQPICQSCGSGHCPPHSRNPKVFLTIPARIGTPFQPFKGNREPEMARRCSEHSSRLSPGAVDHICVKPAGTRGHLLHHNIARNKTRRQVLSVLPCHDI